MGVLGIETDWEWRNACSFLPFDLDSFAVEHGGLARRRGVSSGEELVRTLLLCGMPKSSFSVVSRMSGQAGLAKMNPSAVFKRLAKSEALLRELFSYTLRFAAGREETWKGFRLLAVDATTLCGPGATQTDQRLHVVYNLGSGLPLSVEVTSIKGGETLLRHQSFGHGDLLIGDRGYGHPKGLHSALRSGARLLVRFEFESMRFFNEKDEKIAPEHARSLAEGLELVEFPVFLDNWVGPLRAIGSRNPKGEMVWLVTDLSPEELPAGQVRVLYSKRWQIELFFKRLKSLLDLDELPTRDGPTARPWIWAKLLAASLTILLSHERFSPWNEPSDNAKPMGMRQMRSLGSYANVASACQAQKTRQAKGKEQKENPQAKLALEV